MMFKCTECGNTTPYPRPRSAACNGGEWVEIPDEIIDEIVHPVETFQSGATRNPSDDKYDYEGFISPFVVERFGQYMHSHRKQRDGSVRDSDNWQKGIPLTAYAKSLVRHVMEFWRTHRGGGEPIETADGPITLEDCLCAIIFNASGYLHELLKAKRAK